MSSRVYTTLAPQRRVFDWYLECFHYGRATCAPLVVDADDVIERSETMLQLCGELGMKDDELLHEWPCDGEAESQDGRVGRFLKSIRCSTGVETSKSCKGLTLAGRFDAWVEEFGAAAAEALAERVRASWPDYEYLRSWRLS